MYIFAFFNISLLSIILHLTNIIYFTLQNNIYLYEYLYMYINMDILKIDDHINI